MKLACLQKPFAEKIFYYAYNNLLKILKMLEKAYIFLYNE